MRSWIRGWNVDELGGLTGGSLWRMFAVVADVARDTALRDVAPTQGLYENPQSEHYVE